jgi:flagellar hook-associated protein 1 FlgK
VTDVNAALDQANLSFTPESGEFQVLVRNKQTGLTTTTNVPIDLTGLDADTTLQSLATALNSIDGISAEITSKLQLQLKSDSSNFEFAFANDTSGTLASLGLNTFFSGDSASSFSLNEDVVDEPARFAASRNGIAEDTENAVTLAGLLDVPLESKNGSSLALLYSRMATETTHGSAVTRSVAEGFRVFQKALESEELSITGVSLDEEAIRMITYQRVFQLSARFIGTCSDLLETLVDL